MNSLAFPEMFHGSKTSVIYDYEATLNNLKLLLTSDRNGLYGDPSYGTKLKAILYNQNSVVLKDIVIDEIYTCIVEYLPQIILSRRDIDIKGEDNTLYITLKATNVVDYTTNMYTIRLLDEEQL